MSDFQWIIDRAEQMSIDRTRLIASTTARDGTTRTVSRGGQAWKFTVKLPDGLPWNEIRQYISTMEYVDMITVSTFKLSNTGHDWIVKYQGDASLPKSMTASWIMNSPIITIQSGGGTIPDGGYRFRAGDFIQLGSNHVYTVAKDCPKNATTVTLHRPVLSANLNGALKVAEDCEWHVKCIQMPKWKLTSKDQVSWDGEFVFQEANYSEW